MLKSHLSLKMVAQSGTSITRAPNKETVIQKITNHNCIISKPNLCSDDLFESSRRDDSDNGHIMGFTGEVKMFAFWICTLICLSAY